MTTGEGGFALVASHPDSGAMRITEYDHHSLMLRRHEWRVVKNHSASTKRIELIITDWEDQVIARHTVDEIPTPPGDGTELARLILPT